MPSLHQLVAKASRHREQIEVIELRIEHLRAVEPEDERHAATLQSLVEMGERFLKDHEAALADCLAALASQMADGGGLLGRPMTTASFEIPVLAEAQAAMPVGPRPPLLRK